MTKRDIVLKVQEELGLPVSTVSALIDDMIQIMKNALVEGEDVKIARFEPFSRYGNDLSARGGTRKPVKT